MNHEKKIHPDCLINKRTLRKTEQETDSPIIPMAVGGIKLIGITFASDRPVAAKLSDYKEHAEICLAPLSSNLSVPYCQKKADSP
jgi:hypothetical protein